MNTAEDEMTMDDKLDLFCDFLDSDEWIFPVQSFIDYYCVVFASQDPQENFTEKQVVYKEYKEIVCSNLDKFLAEVLGFTREKNLPQLLEEYDGDYEELEYLLAVEDYQIFHTFMFEENQELDKKAQGRGYKPRHQRGNNDTAAGLDLEGGNAPKMQKKMTKEERELELAMAASMADSQSSKKKEMTEEEMIMQAILESQQDADSKKKSQMSLKEQEDEEIRRAIEESQNAELERQETIKTKKLKQENLKQQLKEEAMAKEAKMHAEVQRVNEEMKQEEIQALDKLQLEVDKQMILEKERLAEEAKRVKEEAEFRRKQMLQKLKEQAEAADKKIAQAQDKMGGQTVQPEVVGKAMKAAEQTPEEKRQVERMSVLQAAGSSMARTLNDLPVIGSNTHQVQHIEEVKVESNVESLEERQARLRARAADMKKAKEVKAQEEANIKPEENKQADVFRRTGLQWGETADDKKARLARCVNALKNVQIGTGSNFRPLEGLNSDPRNMGFNTRQEMDEDSDSGCDVTEAEIEILNKGKKLKYEVI